MAIYPPPEPALLPPTRRSPGLLPSADAAFICLHAPPRTDRSVPGLALGFFHLDKIEAPRFVPLPSASRLLGVLGPPSLDRFADGEGRKILDASSRVVASRAGRLVVEIHRPTKSGSSTLELCVCNPVSGEADVLPCLRGDDDAPGPYACALLAVDDLRYYCKDDAPPRSALSYRLVLVFDRDGFTAYRCFCSDAGRWGPEARVTGGRPARIDTTWLHWPQGTIMHRGVVFWPRLKFALLTLPAVNTMVVVYHWLVYRSSLHQPTRVDPERQALAGLDGRRKQYYKREFPRSLR